MDFHRLSHSLFFVFFHRSKLEISLQLISVEPDPISSEHEGKTSIVLNFIPSV